MPDEMVAHAELHWGRWIARCPRPGCANAEGLGPQDDGVAGGLTFDAFRCRAEVGGCGLTARAVWPRNRRQLEAVAAARPVPGTRNWLPGQSYAELVAENLEHGVPVPDDVPDHLVAAALEQGV